MLKQTYMSTARRHSNGDYLHHANSNGNYVHHAHSNGNCPHVYSMLTATATIHSLVGTVPVQHPQMFTA